MRSRTPYAPAAALLVAILLAPAILVAQGATGPQPDVLPAEGAGRVDAPSAEASPTAGAGAQEWVAIPITREFAGGILMPFLYLVDLAAFGLTKDAVVAAGIPLVPSPGEGDVSNEEILRLAMSFPSLVEALTEVQQTRGVTTGVGAFGINVPISLYADQSVDAFGDNTAQTAWNDARGVLAAEGGITFSQVFFGKDMVVFPGDPNFQVSDVSNDCHMQRFAYWEETAPNPASAVVIFSNGKVQPTGWPEPTYGVAIDGPVAKRLSEGHSNDFCTGKKRTPAYIPTAHVSVDLAWAYPIASERPAPSHWAAHEIAHLFEVGHGLADCTWQTGTGAGYHQHKTLEAATSGGGHEANCVPHNQIPPSHYHFTFSPEGRTKMSEHHTRWSSCKSAGWCTSDASPGPVQITQAQRGDGQVTLTWTPPATGGSAIQRYWIYHSTAGEGFQSDNAQSRSEGAGNQFTVSGLTNGQTYWFYVRAQNSADWNPAREGPRGNYMSAMPAAAPAAPTLNTPFAGNGYVDLSWTTPANGGLPITGYKVYRATCSGCTATEFSLGVVTSWRDGSVANGQAYFYKVAAVNAVGTGAQSNERQANPVGPPGAPTLDSATPGNGIVDLAWTAPSSNGGTAITSYSVYRATCSNCQGSTAYATGITTTTWRDNAATNGQTYYYKVSAVNSAGTGTKSNEKSATPSSGGGGGTPSSNPADAPRLIGGEMFVLQMDLDDNNLPSSGQTRDSSPNARHGTNLGATSTTFAKFGNAWSFAGANQRMTVAETGIAMPSGTVMMWIYPTANSGRIFYKQEPGVYNYLALSQGSDGRIDFNTDQVGTHLRGTSVVPLNQWTHLAVTWGTAGKKIYINGNLDASNTDTRGVGSGYTYTMIGNSPNDVATGGFNGAIDEVREYSTALSQANIQSLKDLPYVGTGPGPSPDPAKAARIIGNEKWVLQMDLDDHNQPTTGKTRDSSSALKHATLTSVTLTTTAKFGRAYSFAGIGQSITVPDTGAMASGTVMMWIYPTQSAVRMMYKQEPGVYNEFALGTGSDNKVYFQTSQSSPSLASTSTVPLNQWTHVAVTWGSAGKRIYLNGNLAGSNSDTVGVGSQYSQTMLGNSPNDTGNGGFHGAMDEVREYGVALSQADIQSLKDFPYYG